MLDQGDTRIDAQTHLDAFNGIFRNKSDRLRLIDAIALFLACEAKQSGGKCDKQLELLVFIVKWC